MHDEITNNRSEYSVSSNDTSMGNKQQSYMWTYVKNYLSSLNKSLCYSPVPATIAGCDKISHSTTFKESA